MLRLLNLGHRSRPYEKERRVFSPDYYRHANPDVAASGVDPFEHYMEHGWIEGRNPSRHFVTLFYRDRHLAGQWINPLTHYVTVGEAEGLATAPASEDEYLVLQAQVSRPLFVGGTYGAQSGNVGGDPLRHYLKHGWREGHAPSPFIDPNRYMREHEFIGGLAVSPLYHVASQERLQAARPAAAHETEQSRSAPRKPVPTEREIKTVVGAAFEKNFYLACNADVRAAGTDALEHYVRHGYRENRRPNRLFDPRFYLEQNPDVAQSGWEPFYHYLKVGKAEGRRGNPIGERLYPDMVEPAGADWASLTPAQDVAAARCVVVMPVYKGYGETLASIFAILSAPQQTRFALYVLNDRSPDPRLSAVLLELADRGLFFYAVNKANLGFVKTVNRALRDLDGKTVVLMNTDAKVSGDWLDRMVAHIERDPTIGTVTPFSNNATICSYPLINENNEIEMEVDAAGLDRLAARCNSGRVSEIPVGIGFCFLISETCLQAVGLLDEEAFGTGYGEENDFCLRATRAGFRNVLAEDVFVYHVGQVSFGIPDPAKTAPGQDALIRKHPIYPELIRQHLVADATETGRIRLDLMRIAAAASKPVVFVYHGLSGGIVTHVRCEEQRLNAAGSDVIHVRVGVDNRWGIEVRSGSRPPPYCPNLRVVAFEHLRPHLTDFLTWLQPQTIHVHSLVGLDWYAMVGMLDLIRQAPAPYRFTLHDYSAVCHRNDLVMPNNRYCGLAPSDTCRACIASDRHYPEAIDPDVRRATFAAFLQGAEQVYAPSKDIAERMKRAGASYAIKVVQHEPNVVAAPRLLKRGTSSEIRLVTIGAIGPHKGSRVILNVARDAKARSLPLRYHIIGYSDVTLDLTAAGVTETGRYSDDEVALELAKALDPAFVFLPSIWPETFSFTLSMAFRLGVRPLVFDLGAPAERIREARFGVILPYRLVDDPHGLNDALLELTTSAPARDYVEWGVEAGAA